MQHEANLALLEQELTVSAELKGEGGEGEGVLELVDLENDSDLLEAGIGSEESLGSDSDPSGDNMPPNLLLKDKDFQKFVQRSTVAPQLAHMELNSGRRNQHRKTSKALKSKRKKKKSTPLSRFASAATKVINLNKSKKAAQDKANAEKARQQKINSELATNDLLQPRPILPKPLPARKALNMTTVQMTRKTSMNVPSDTVNVRGVNVRRGSTSAVASVAQKYVDTSSGGSGIHKVSAQSPTNMMKRGGTSAKHLYSNNSNSNNKGKTMSGSGYSSSSNQPPKNGGTLKLNNLLDPRAQVTTAPPALLVPDRKMRAPSPITPTLAGFDGSAKKESSMGNRFNGIGR